MTIKVKAKFNGGTRVWDNLLAGEGGYQSISGWWRKMAKDIRAFFGWQWQVSGWWYGCHPPSPGYFLELRWDTHLFYRTSFGVLMGTWKDRFLSPTLGDPQVRKAWEKWEPVWGLIRKYQEKTEGCWQGFKMCKAEGNWFTERQKTEPRPQTSFGWDQWTGCAFLLKYQICQYTHCVVWPLIRTFVWLVTFALIIYIYRQQGVLDCIFGLFRLLCWSFSAKNLIKFLSMC